MKTIDADAHVIETPYTFEFMDESEQGYVPLVVGQTSGPTKLSNEGNVRTQYWIVDNHAYAKDLNMDSRATADSREMRDVDARLAHMDELEIDVQVLYPTLFLRPCTDNPATELALCKSYNRWLAEIWRKGQGRLRWVAMPPLLSMDRMRDELTLAKDNGACGIFMRALECEKTINDPYFFPLYELASELDLAVCYHAGNGSFQNHGFFFPQSFSFNKLTMVGAFHGLIYDGVPARFPGVRWAFIECSSQWIPYAVHDLQLRCKQKGRPLAKRPLADNNIWVACQVDDDLEYVLTYAGEDNLVVGTDYGHTDTSAEIEAMRLIKDKVPAGVVEKILGPNAQALYGLD